MSKIKKELEEISYFSTPVLIIVAVFILWASMLIAIFDQTSQFVEKKLKVNLHIKN